MNNKENCSISFQSGNRTYFLDAEKTDDGDRYLILSEIRKITETDSSRQEIILLEDSIEKFADALNKVVAGMKQSVGGMKQSGKAYSVDEKRKVNPQAYTPWTVEDDTQLELLYRDGKTITELSEIFGRNNGAIRSRIKKLELN